MTATFEQQVFGAMSEKEWEGYSAALQAIARRYGDLPHGEADARRREDLMALVLEGSYVPDGNAGRDGRAGNAF
ncbi:MAG TPA: hypothetical protein VGX68_29045 [Thermoanaerobaculia bacterium]|nr:hypothetical protein [Thermoanaerobaculia bacterium]